jgi:PAS domain S-box-containing protein
VDRQIHDIFESEHVRSIVDIFAGMAGTDVLVADYALKPLYCTDEKSWLYKFISGEGDNFKWLEKLRKSLLSAIDAGREAVLDYQDGITIGLVPVSMCGKNFGNLLIAVRKICDLSGLKDADEASGEHLGDELPYLPPGMDEVRFGQVFSYIMELGDTLLHFSDIKTQFLTRNEIMEDMSRQMSAQYSMHQKFFDAKYICIYVFDFYTGDMITANKAYCEMAGMDLVDMIGKKCWEVDGNTREAFAFVRESFAQNGDAHRAWTYYNEKFGKWLKSTAQALSWYGGVKAIMMNVLDVSREEELRGELYKFAYYDAKSGLPNELKLREDIKIKISKDTGGISGISPYNEPLGLARGDVSLIILDMAPLWNIRNTYGRESAENILDAVLKWCEDQAFHDTKLYRMSMYRFCAMVNGTDHDKVRLVAQKMLQRLQEPWEVLVGETEVSYFSGAKISIVFLPGEGMPVADVVSRIMGAIDAPRESGKILEYDEAMDTRRKEEIRFRESLKKCVHNGMTGFDVHFQPIVSMATGKWEGVEALCRWNNPETGMVAPSVFIPEAERTGLIVMIGIWVMDKAVERCKALGLDKFENFFLSVNVSPIQLMNQSFVSHVLEILRKHDYPGNMLNIEITESVEVTFNKFTLSVIEALRASGVVISLDDFGTGYSSFNNLKNLPIDRLKTECGFVRGIEHDTYTQYYFNIIVDMAHVSGMKLITEGVDNDAQLDIVNRNGADYVQGYYFSMPLPFEELSASLHNFSEPCGAVRRSRADVKIKRWLDCDSALLMTPGLSNLLGVCMNALCSDGLPTTAAFREVLEIVGKTFGLFRAFVFRSRNGVTFSKVYEWCSEKSGAYADIIAAREVGQMPEKLISMFRGDGIIVSSDVAKLSAEARRFFSEMGTGAIALLPIWDGDEFAGVAGFDDNKKREWSSDEIIMLRNLGAAISRSLQHERLIAELTEKKGILMSVLNSNGLAAFVTDPETDEILWVNDELRGIRGDRQLLDNRKCYEVMEGRSSRCPHCKIDELVKNPDTAKFSFEHQNSLWKRPSLVYQSLIQWSGGKHAHIEYAVDMSDRWRMQKLMSAIDSANDSDGVMDTRSLMEHITYLAKTGDCHDVTVAWVGLRYVDSEGETPDPDGTSDLSVSAARYVQGCVRGHDVIGWLNDGEFAVVFDGCDAELAAKRLLAAHYILAAQNMEHNGRAVGIRFGVADIKGLAKGGGDFALRAVEIARDNTRDAVEDGEETVAI